MTDTKRLEALMEKAEGMGFYASFTGDDYDANGQGCTVRNVLNLSHGHVNHKFPIRDKAVLPEYDGPTDIGGTQYSLDTADSLLALRDPEAPAFRCPDATFKECFENRHDTERCAILPLFAVGDCIMGKLCVDEDYEIVLVRRKVVR